MRTMAEMARECMCPRCEARPGQPCVTMNGHRTGTHQARIWPLLEAYALGYDEGQKAVEVVTG